MPEELTPIETEYMGCKFRSRLEARWAVYFQSMGWKWEYEYEGFKLPSGYYLPDFYFYDTNIFAEVKPATLSPIELRKCIELSERTYNGRKVNVLLLVGTPEDKSYEVLMWNGHIEDAIITPYGQEGYPLFYSTYMGYDNVTQLESVSKAKMERFQK